MRRHPAADIHVATCHAYTAPKATSDPRDRANAAFIVRAVNSHERLVAALRELHDQVVEWAEAEGHEAHLVNTPEMRAARAALAEVEK